jgi:hypothetical protein
MYTPPDLIPELVPFVEDQIWTARAPLRFYGVPMGCRMTVCRLADGRLLVHSPIALDTVKARLDALGEIAFAVAPNFIHHLFMTPFLSAYPQARLYVSPKLVSKRPDLRAEGVLGDDPPEGTWGDSLDQALVRGSRLMDEVVFLHRSSRTLILCDLCECVHSDAPWLWRQVGRFAGIYEHYGPPRDMKLSFRNREALRAFVERVLAWDFDRIVLSHGKLVEHGGKDVFRQAYSFCG